MEVNLHLHRGDGHTAKVEGGDIMPWFTLKDKDEVADLTIFIPTELKADAEAFAESINQYCLKRVSVR